MKAYTTDVLKNLLLFSFYCLLQALLFFHKFVFHYSLQTFLILKKPKYIDFFSKLDIFRLIRYNLNMGALLVLT